MNRIAAILVVLAGCGSDVDEPWMLDHDRIIAVRATPPHLMPGEQATLDVLLGFAQQPPAERAPDAAAVVSPTSLANAVAFDRGQWVVTAPSEAALAAARTELKLPPDAPVPLRVGVSVTWPYPVKSVDGSSFTATKIVWLGDRGANPTMAGMSINAAAAPATASELVVPKNEKVPLYVEADDTVDIVNWLTSCGEMHDFDLHSAYLVVTPESNQEGELALVFRDDRGGVTWRVWPIHAE